MSDERNRQVLRSMAWERAKGELRSILHTFYPEYDSNNKKIDNGYEDLEERIDNFIDEMESEQKGIP